MFCGALTRSGGRCRRHALAGKRRCRLHGGLSTGPINWRPSVAAMMAGRERYIERRHAMGLKAPGGRLPNPERLQTLAQQAIAAAELMLRWLDEPDVLGAVHRFDAAASACTATPAEI